MDTTIMYIVPPERPDGFGVTSSEFAQKTNYSHDGARRVLIRQEGLVAVTMRDRGKRVSVFVERDVAEENEWYRAWIK